MLGRAVACWFGLMVIAILNGTVREFVITPRTSPATGHVISTVLLSALIVAATWLVVPWIAPPTPAHAWLVGLCWLGLTIAFEFGFGRARGKSWETLLADYNLAAGRIWVLVLLATATAPYLAGMLRNQWSSH